MGCDWALQRLFERLEDEVSQLSQKISDLNAAFDAALARVQGDVDTLNTKVAELQAKVDSGVATDQELADLDALKTRIEALDPTKDTVLPPEGGPDTEAPPAPETP